MKVATEVYEQVILSRWCIKVAEEISNVAPGHFSVNLTLSPDLKSFDQPNSKTSILIPAGDSLNFRFSHPREFLYYERISAKITFEPFKTQAISYNVRFKNEKPELEATCWLESDSHQKICIKN